MKTPRPRFPSTNDASPRKVADGKQAASSNMTIALFDLRPGAPIRPDDSSQRRLDEVCATLDRQPVDMRAWTPYSQEDCNIEIGGEASKRVRLDELLAGALAPLGYQRVAKLIYRANWSTRDVEHMLRFDTFGNPKIYLAGDPGLRNAQAEAFANRCRKRYAKPIMSQFEFEDKLGKWWCPVHFALGGLCDWDVRHSLDMTEYSPGALAKKVADDVREKLLPLVTPIKTCADLLAFLDKDDKTRPPMIQMGEFYRAAQIAFLACKLARPRAKTEEILRGFTRYMASSLDEPRVTPETYIEHILDDAEAAVAQAAT
jgi:hypothetical protein